MRATVRFGVLGPTEVTVDGAPLPLGGPKQSLVLALLLVECGQVVPVERLVEAVWGEDARARSAATLQVYISNLRKVLEPARAVVGVPELIATRRPGYVVPLGAEHVDVAAFTATVQQARAAADRGDHVGARQAYRGALGLWRGAALAGFEDTPLLDAVRARLDGERHQTLLDAFDAELACGRHAELVGELKAAVTSNPLDERLYGQLMLALYRSGRQAEALSVFHMARDRLVDELGIEPGRQLRDLEARVLRHDPVLDAPRATVDVSRATATVLRSTALPDVAVVVDGQRVPLVRTVTTLGRRQDRHLVLDGDDVSRLHAELRLLDGVVEVVDVGSANGVRVNGVRVASCRLSDGDEIRIGGHVLRVEVGCAR